MIKKILKLGFFFFSIVIIVSIVVIYLKDEKLTAEARQYYNEMSFEEIKPENNNFYYYMGFDFDPQNNPVEKFNNYLIAKRDMNNSKIREYFSESPVPIIEFIDRDIRSWKEEYLALVCNNHSFIDSLYDTYGVLESEFFNVSLHQSFLSITDILYSKENNLDYIGYDLLRNAKLAQRFLYGDEDEVINDISKLFIHIRTLMTQADSYETKLSFLIIFEQNLMLIDKLLDSSNHDFSVLERLIQEIEPISKTERDFTKCIRKEFWEDLQIIEGNPQLRLIGYKGIFWKIYFLLTTSKNKYINRNLPKFKYIKKLSMISALDFFNEKQNIEENYLGNMESELVTAQNFHGTWLYDTFLYYTFIDKFHQVDCYITLLKLKLEIYKNKITEENIPTFLMTHKETFYNPYTKDVIKWDKEKSTLFIGDEYIEDWNSLGQIKIKL